LREMRPSPIALISSRPCYTAAKTRLYGRALANLGGYVGVKAPNRQFNFAGGVQGATDLNLTLVSSSAGVISSGRGRSLVLEMVSTACSSMNTPLFRISSAPRSASPSARRKLSPRSGERLSASINLLVPIFRSERPTAPAAPGTTRSVLMRVARPVSHSAGIGPTTPINKPRRSPEHAVASG